MSVHSTRKIAVASKYICMSKCILYKSQVETLNLVLTVYGFLCLLSVCLNASASVTEYVICQCICIMIHLVLGEVKLLLLWIDGFFTIWYERGSHAIIFICTHGYQISDVPWTNFITFYRLIMLAALSI